MPVDPAAASARSSQEDRGAGRPPRDTETVLRVARMRYDQRMSPGEIARTLGFSESTISRTLKAAMDRGFVEIQVTPDGWRDSDAERSLVRQFGLTAAIVVHPRTPEQGRDTILARAAARWLEKRLVPGSVLGVSDGETVAAVANAMRGPRAADLDVVSLIGGIGAPQLHTHSTEICRVLAAHIGARAWNLPIPAVVEDIETADALRKIASVRSIFDVMERTSVALVGIGAMSAQASIFRHGMIDQGRIQSMIDAGAVGSICARFYDRNGLSIASEFERLTMAITLADQVRVPLRLGVAAGLGKVEAIVAALRGGLMNVLATDLTTASAIKEHSFRPSSA